MKSEQKLGLSLKNNKVKHQETFAEPDNNDGSLMSYGNHYSNSNHISHTLNLDAGVTSLAQLINRYREAALHSEVDMAITEITNEAIINNEENDAVEIVLDKLDEPDKIKKIILEEHNNILNLLNFYKDGKKLFREWYVDSKVFFHIIVDSKKPKDGIKALRKIDPRKILPIKIIEKKGNYIEIVDEFYIYYNKPLSYNRSNDGYFSRDFYHLSPESFRNEKTFASALRIEKDAISYVHSNLIDYTTGIVYGHLEKCLKPLNNLKALEDSMIVNRLARSTERRIFYIDTEYMTPAKGDYYVQQIANRYRNRINYDAKTGEITSDSNVLALQEDYWFRRGPNGRGTEVDTLPGASNLGDIDDVLYFKEKLYNSTNIPVSRYKEDAGNKYFGNVSEITQEEDNFIKFIEELQINFLDVFKNPLKIQLILKGVVDLNWWENNQHKIRYKFYKNSRFEDARYRDDMNDRLDLLNNMKEYIGKFISYNTVMKDVLGYTPEEIERELKQIEKEKKDKFWQSIFGEGDE